jgi:hypothetical protein
LLLISRIVENFTYDKKAAEEQVVRFSTTDNRLCIAGKLIKLLKAYSQEKTSET